MMEDVREPATLAATNLRATVPTVLRRGPYRFFFYSGDRSELMHVHFERDSRRAKIWLTPLRLHDRGDFTHTEIRRIVEMTRTNADFLRNAWNEYFAD
jgi:hypothetical protein